MFFFFSSKARSFAHSLARSPARLERKRLLRKPLGVQFALVPFALFPTCTCNERKKIRENKELLRVFAYVTSFPLSHGDLQYFSAGLNCLMRFSDGGLL